MEMTGENNMRDHFLSLVGEYVVKIQNGKISLEWFINDYWVGCEVVRTLYQILVNEKELTPIENIEEKEKVRIKGIIRKWGSGDVNNRMTQAKALYLIEQLMQKKIEL